MNRFIQQKGGFPAMKILCAALTACCVLSFAANLHPLPPPDPIVASLGPILALINSTTTPAGSVSITSREQVFERVGVLPNQVLDIVVQYPLTAVGHAITPEPLDAGSLLAVVGPLIVGPDGKIHFQFQVPGDPGVCRVSLHDSIVPEETGLEFWIMDPANPDQNPPVLVLSQNI
jgi:hypothetical protein